MIRLKASLIILTLGFTAAAAQAQPEEEKRGWHRHSGIGFGIEKGREGNLKPRFKMELETDTVIIRENSENAKICADRASYPDRADLEYCKAALTEETLTPENRYSATYNMGLMYLELDDTDLAISYFNQAALLSPDRAESYHALSRIETKRGDFENAMTYAKRALKTKPQRVSDIYITIGYLHERDFEFDEARTAYSAALSSNAGSSDARRRLERLNRLWPAK